jgi:hypothetical protein
MRPVAYRQEAGSLQFTVALLNKQVLSFVVMLPTQRKQLRYPSHYVQLQCIRQRTGILDFSLNEEKMQPVNRQWSLLLFIAGEEAIFREIFYSRSTSSPPLQAFSALACLSTWSTSHTGCQISPDGYYPTAVSSWKNPLINGSDGSPRLPDCYHICG